MIQRGIIQRIEENAIMSALEIYEKNIRQLPAIDRLGLASLILEDLTACGDAGVNVRDDWSKTTSPT